MSWRHCSNLLAAALVVGGALGARVAAQTGPRLELGQSDWDFGQIWTGDPCSIEVELKNVGDETLRILEIKKSCGCTTAEPGKRELAPGESDSMTVAYDTKRNSKKVNHTIRIVTNDSDQPETKFVLHGEVWNVFDAEPVSALSFGRVKPTSRRSMAIELTNNLKEKAYPHLRPIDANVPFDIKLEEIEPGMKYRLSAQTKPPLKYGNNQVMAEIDTGVERLPTMSIKVSALATERVAISPNALHMIPSQKRTSARTLQIYYEEERPLDITEILCDLPGVTVRKLPRQLPSTFSEFAVLQLQVSLPPFDELPETGAVLEIHTNDPDPRYQKFVVPIQRMVSSKRKTSAPSDESD